MDRQSPYVDYAMINNKAMELGKKMSKSPIGKYSLAGWSFQTGAKLKWQFDRMFGANASCIKVIFC